MSAFAAAPDLSIYLGMDVDTARADALLDLASDAIRGTIQQALDLIEDDTITLDPEPSLVSAFLPELPVTDVSLVEQLGRDGSWTTLSTEQYDWSANGVLYRTRAVLSGAPLAARWTDRRASIRVTYSHGYETIPPELVGVSISAAARLYENPLGLVATAIGSFSEQYGGRTPGVEFTAMELAILDKFVVARIG